MNGITCKITSLSQRFEFSSGKQMTMISLLLPNARVLELPVTDEVAEELILIAMDRPTPMPQVEQNEVTSQESDVKTVVFGGEGVGDVEEDVLPTSDVMTSAPLINGAPKVRAKLVGVDSKGNPIMAYPDGVDPAEVTGPISANADEDGVSQL